MRLMNEKEAFGKRLTRLLNDAGIGIASPTHVTREFNREEDRSAYGEDAVATLPDDFQRLTPRHKFMVCEIVHALLRAEKR